MIVLNWFKCQVRKEIMQNAKIPQAVNRPQFWMENSPKLTKFSYLFLLALSACNGDNLQNAKPSGSLQIDRAATVPVLADTATTTVIYIHNTSDREINNISYNVVDNNASSGTAGFSLNPQFCHRIAAHASCALEFTTPQLSAKGGDVQGSAMIRANFILEGKASYSQQLINYTLFSASSGLNISSDVSLQTKQNGVIYLYAASESYSLQAIQSDSTQIRESQRSSQTLNARHIVAIELVSAEINTEQNVKLKLDYQNQIRKSTNSSQFSVNVTPVTNGAILTSGQMPILNTTQSTAGEMLIYNSGNQAVTIGSITGNNGISISSSGSERCVSNMTNLAAGGSCTVYFTVPQQGNTGAIVIAYGSNQLTQSVTWYNSINDALLQMVANPNSVSFSQGDTSSPLMVTVINIGGYDLTAMSMPTATNPDGGSATTITSSALSCKSSSNLPTGTDLPVGGSCTYALTLADTIAEANKTMLLKIGGNYTGSGGVVIYQRAIAISYTSVSIGRTIAISNLTGNIPANVMGTTAITFSATISGSGSSTLSASLTNSLTGTIVSDPSPCALDTAGTRSCNFSIIPWYTGFDNSVLGLANYDPFMPTDTRIELFATNSATISGSGVTNNKISYSITIPYVYLAAPEEGASSPTNVGITWGAGGATVVPTRFESGTQAGGAACQSGQAVVVDKLTDLMWVKAPTNITYGWANAQIAPAIPATYCGYTDWRLPTINELLSLINYGILKNSRTAAEWLNSNGFSNVQQNGYWSSTRYDTEYSWGVSFFIGNTGFARATDGYYVLPVRGGVN